MTPQNNLNKNKCLSDLFDQSHILTYLKETDGFLIEGTSAQNMEYLDTYCGLESINPNDLVAVFFQDFIKQQNTDNMYTHTPISENVVYRT